MNKEILEENIYYYTNVIENPEKLIAAIEATELKDFGHAIYPWEEWSACSGQMYVYGTHKKIYHSGFETLQGEDFKEAEYVIKTISDAFNKVAKDFAVSHNDQEDPNLYIDFEIKKYEAGTMMGGHFDQQEGDERLKYSLVLYLNEDYEGGEISFTIKGYDALEGDDKPHQDYEMAKKSDKISFGLKPKAGSCIIFPSSAPYHHTAHLIKSGYKYMVPMHWLHKGTSNRVVVENDAM
jgi:hypothetical protein